MTYTMNYDKNTAIRIRDFLLKQGITLEGVYGMMANIYSESGFRSNNAQNSYMNKMGMTDEIYTSKVDNGTYTNFIFDRVGYGLCQWTSSGRKQNLYNFAKSCGKSIGDETMQLNFLMTELNGSYKAVLNILKTSHNISECAKYVMTKFERPADQSVTAQNKRASYGVQLYEELETKEEKKPMKNPIIALSAGHGKYTPGKRCDVNIDPRQTREWELNDPIADKVEKRLQSYNCTVLRVNDTTGNVDTSLSTRVATANQANADIYISIHHNAGIKGGTGGGTVVFYYPTGTCKADATKLYNEIIKYTGLRGNRSTPIANGSHLQEINSTHMPCFLIENGFMDSKIDTPIILTEEHKEKTAIAITNFLVSHLNLTLKTGATAPSTNVSSNTTSNNESTSVASKVNITYAVKVEGGKVLSAVNNLDDYAGIENKKIIGLAIKVDKGTIKYQVHEVGGDWLPYVTGYNWNDHNNGYAGNNKPIDAVRIYYNTPSDLVANGGYREAKYRVSPINSTTYYDWQLDDTVNKAKGMDGYAGAFGKAIDKFQICIE